MFQMLFGSIVLLPLVGVFERPVFPVPAEGVWAVIYLAVFCSVGGYSLYNYGVARMASTQAVNILNLVPVFGVLTSWVVLHETVTADTAGRRSRRPSRRPAQSARFFAGGFSFMTTTGPSTVGPT